MLRTNRSERLRVVILPMNGVAQGVRSKEEGRTVLQTIVYGISEELQ